jgi:hypothetical protein
VEQPPAISPGRNQPGRFRAVGVGLRPVDAQADKPVPQPPVATDLQVCRSRPPRTALRPDRPDGNCHLPSTEICAIHRPFRRTRDEIQ